MSELCYNNFMRNFLDYVKQTLPRVVYNLFRQCSVAYEICQPLDTV